MLCLSAHARREVPLPRLICSKTQPKSGLKCVISPANQIIGNWTNQIARNEPTRRAWLILRPRSNYVHSERIIIGILDFLTDHDHVHLWEMRQRISREDQPDQASKDSCRFFTDLILWDMRQRVQPTRPQKEAMRLPMDNARSSPARSATIPSREKTIFTSMCRPTREEWTRHHRPDQRKSSRGNCHLQLDPTQSTPRPSRQQRPTKKRTELQPTRRFYLTTPRPEPCIYSIGRRKPE